MYPKIRDSDITNIVCYDRAGRKQEDKRDRAGRKQEDKRDRAGRKQDRTNRLQEDLRRMRSRPPASDNLDGTRLDA